MKTVFYRFGVVLSILIMVNITFRKISISNESLSSLIWGARMLFLFQSIEFIFITFKKIEGKISHQINQIFNIFFVINIYLTLNTDYLTLLFFTTVYSIFICIKCQTKLSILNLAATPIKYVNTILVLLMWYLQNSLLNNFIKQNAQLISDTTITVIRCYQLLFFFNRIYQLYLIWQKKQQITKKQHKDKLE